MPTATVLNAINQLAQMDFRGVINLNHYNEPLIDDRIAAFGAYARCRLLAKSVELFSNADLLDADRAAELDGIFDQITFSLYHPLEKQPAIKAKIRGWFNHTKPVFTKGEHTISHNSPLPGLATRIAKVIDTPCTYYHQRFILAHDGTALFCCQDYSGHFDLGNIYNMSLVDIWNGPKYLKLEDDLSRPAGRRLHDYCRSCPI